MVPLGFLARVLAAAAVASGALLLPIPDLADAGPALFLRQRPAVGRVVAEARRRPLAGRRDDSELYDGESADGVAGAASQAEPGPTADGGT